MAARGWSTLCRMEPGWSAYHVLLWCALIILLVMCLRSIFWQMKNREYLMHALPEKFKNRSLDERRKLTDHMFWTPRHLAVVVLLLAALIALRLMDPDAYEKYLCPLLRSC